MVVAAGVAGRLAVHVATGHRRSAGHGRAVQRQGVHARAEADDVHEHAHRAEVGDRLDGPEALLVDAEAARDAALLPVGDQDHVAVAPVVGERALLEEPVEGLGRRRPVAAVGGILGGERAHDVARAVGADVEDDAARIAVVLAVDRREHRDPEVDALRERPGELLDRGARGAPLREPARQIAGARGRHRGRAIDDDHHPRRLAARLRAGGGGGENEGRGQ